MILPSWCIQPTSDPVRTARDSSDCPITFSNVPSGSNAPALSVDTAGGLASNPEYCGVGGVGSTFTLLDYADRTLGNRTADYRRWLYHCKDGTQWQIEQYVADNAPGYILFSEHADATVHDVMASIAESAQLPAISAPLRLSDYGIIRGFGQEAGGYRIALDRVIDGSTGTINNNPTIYPYDVPASAVPTGQTLKLGDRVELTTDGTTVTSFSIYP